MCRKSGVTCDAGYGCDLKVVLENVFHDKDAMWIAEVLQKLNIKER
jgi:hypothetical protein